MQTYDPKAVIVTYGGFPITGYADGTFLNVENDEDAFSKNVGADGTVARAKSNNDSGAVTLTLQQTSLANDYLSGIAILDRRTGAGILPLVIKDMNGTTLFFSLGWIRKKAAAGFSKGIETREWVIDCENLGDGIVGGNALFGVNA